MDPTFCSILGKSKNQKIKKSKNQKIKKGGQVMKQEEVKSFDH
jgi:hypothetical protein